MLSQLTFAYTCARGHPEGLRFHKLRTKNETDNMSLLFYKKDCNLKKKHVRKNACSDRHNLPKILDLSTKNIGGVSSLQKAHFVKITDFNPIKNVNKSQSEYILSTGRVNRLTSCALPLTSLMNYEDIHTTYERD